MPPTQERHDLHFLSELILVSARDPAAVRAHVRHVPDLREHVTTRHDQAGCDRARGPHPAIGEDRPDPAERKDTKEDDGDRLEELAPVEGLLVGDGNGRVARELRCERARFKTSGWG